jgi:hypothetical protein
VAPHRQPDISAAPPALYEIRVCGILDEEWRDFCEEMTIEVTEDDARPVTVVRIVVQDQAALAGLMNALFGINATVLSVVAVAAFEGAKPELP